MNNYVSVGNIIEQERLKRQEQISKGISSEVFDHIEKAHSDDFSQVEVTTDDNLTRFANDISQLNKAETELLLNKLQRQINADSTSQLLKSFRSIALSHMDAIEKGICADIEKAHNVGDVHPNGKWVWTDLGNGKFDWKSKNGKYHNGGKGNQEQANAKTSGKKPQKKSVLDSKVDIYTIPNKEYRRITQHLEKKNPNTTDAERYLEEEAMSDKELRNFLAVAEYFSHSSKVNKLTREYCQKWAELARDEVRNRKKQK